MNKILFSAVITAAALFTMPTDTFAQSKSQMEEFKKLKNRDAAIEKYLVDNKIEGVMTSPDGFYYVIEKQGTGAFPQAGNHVHVHYVGTRLDGKKFDSSRDRGQPFSFTIGQGQVIKGWDKGIPLFREGSRGKLFLPAEVAYGARGAGADIPANTPLIFDIEVFSEAEAHRAEQEAAARRAEEEKRQAATAQADEPAKIDAYLKANAAKNFQKGNKGLLYSIETAGTGAKAKAGDQVSIHFSGSFLDGRALGSSRQGGKPIPMTVGENRMIPGGGFDEAVQLLGKGGKGTFVFPSALALGAQTVQNIPAYTPMVFEIEVVELADAEALKVKEAAMRVEQQKQIDAFAKANNLTIKTTASGLSYYVEKQGDGAKVVAGKEISVHYTGKLLDGTKFDSSVDRGEPIQFPLGQGAVIKGWDEGLQLYNVGGKGKLLIPSYLAYGENSPSPTIPANSILIFDVEVVKQ